MYSTVYTPLGAQFGLQPSPSHDPYQSILGIHSDVNNYMFSAVSQNKD